MNKIKLYLISFLIVGFFGQFLVKNPAVAQITQNNSSEIEMLNQIILNNPNDAEAFLKRGVILAAEEDFTNAIKDYDKSLSLEPNNPQTYNYRGTAYYWLENYQKALEDYNQAIRLNPDFALAYYNRAYVHQKLGDIPSAIEDFQQGANLSLKQGDTLTYQEALEMIQELEKEEI